MRLQRYALDVGPCMEVASQGNTRAEAIANLREAVCRVAFEVMAVATVPRVRRTAFRKLVCVPSLVRTSCAQRDSRRLLHP